MEAETLAFLKDIETRRGAPIAWRTFCTWYGTSRHEGLERVWGVFLYRVGDTFYLEDFEHQNTFLGFPVRKRKTDKPYERYEESFHRNEVCGTMQISKRTAAPLSFFIFLYAMFWIRISIVKGNVVPGTPSSRSISRMTRPTALTSTR